MLKGITNAVEATSLEETVHFLFGAELINVIRKENPHMFTEEMEEHVQELVQEAYEAECSIVRWIFEQGDFPYLTVADVEEFIKDRFNTGLEACGFMPPFQVDQTILEKTQWFNLQIMSGMHTDFFAKHPVGYTKFKQGFSAESLF
jgi:ribonucleoside-diphosphate reductase beta chain